MGAQYGHVDTINIGELGDQPIPNELNPKFAIGPAVQIEFMGNKPIMGQAVTLSFKQSQTKFVGPTFSSDNLLFDTSVLANIPTKNIIAMANSASLTSPLVTISGNTTNNLNITAPTGFSNTVAGMRFDVQNITADTTVPSNASFVFYTNIGASTSPTLSLPTTPKEGCCIAVTTFNTAIVVYPGTAGRIFLPLSGVMKAAGTIVTMPANGSSAMFVGVSGLWFPYFMNGSIF